MNYYFKILIRFLLATIFWCNTCCITDKNWLFHSPEGTAMGLFLALALPTDILNRNVYLAYNFEVNYPLPGNSSADVEYPPVILNQERKQVARYINRSVIYDALHTKMNQFGYDGHNCLLKLICEFQMSIFVHNGILSDILHIIFMPSSSKAESLHYELFEAEVNGHQSNCSMYSKCPTNILTNIFSLFD